MPLHTHSSTADIHNGSSIQLRKTLTLCSHANITPFLNSILQVSAQLRNLPGKIPRHPLSGRMVGPQRAWKVWRRGKLPNPAGYGSPNSWSPSLRPSHYAYWAILSSFLQVFRLPLYIAAASAVLEWKDKMYNTLTDKIHFAFSIFRYFKVVSAQTVRAVHFAPRPFFPSEKELYPLNRKLGGSGLEVMEKRNMSWVFGNRTPECPHYSLVTIPPTISQRHPSRRYGN